MMFRNEILGNQGTKCIEVNQLPEKEQLTNDQVLATLKNIEEAELKLRLLKQSLIELQSNCLHHYFNDLPGHPYDVRICYVCKLNMGLV
jgi:hypothetical protein